ncbi:DUF159-domain-containing protein [Clavulina sp. PMI_390]|nr:DUF159-domain-containing protein [Clavulina sp. PMI_390]
MCGSYNIAPRTYSPVIRREGSQDSTSEAGSQLIIQSMRWGVVPHYSKVEDKTLSTINAKGEHLTDGTSSLWNGLKGSKRCVVPIEGYYEWLKKSSDKVPHFTKYKDDRIMMVAGLWDVVTLEGAEEPLYTFTIVTTDSSKQLSFLHDRMPVVLTSEDDIELWLSDSDWSKAHAQLVKPCEEIKFDCYPVPKEVGKVGAEDPSFVRPVSERKDGIEAMFKRQVAGSSSSKLKTTSSPSSSQPSQMTAGSSSHPSPTSPSISKVKKEADSDFVEIIEIADPTADDDVKPFLSQQSPASSSPQKRKLSESSSPPPKTSVSPKKAKKETSVNAAGKRKGQPTATNSKAGSAKITSFFKPQT